MGSRVSVVCSLTKYASVRNGNRLSNAGCASCMLADLFPPVVVSLDEPLDGGLWRLGHALQEGSVVPYPVLGQLHCVPIS